MTDSNENRKNKKDCLCDHEHPSSTDTHSCWYSLDTSDSVNLHRDEKGYEYFPISKGVSRLKDHGDCFKTQFDELKKETSILKEELSKIRNSYKNMEEEMKKILNLNESIRKEILELRGIESRTKNVYTRLKIPFKFIPTTTNKGYDYFNLFPCSISK